MARRSQTTSNKKLATIRGGNVPFSGFIRRRYDGLAPLEIIERNIIHYGPPGLNDGVYPPGSSVSQPRLCVRPMVIAINSNIEAVVATCPEVHAKSPQLNRAETSRRL